MNGLRWSVSILVLVDLVSASAASAADPASRSPQNVNVSSLNAGDVVLIGKLGYPLGTHHTIKAAFAKPSRKVRGSEGGGAYLKILEVDGKPVPEPFLIAYHKAVTYEAYRLPDGSDMFAHEPSEASKLDGKQVVCRVYEVVHVLDSGNDVDEYYRPRRGAFERLDYQSQLGIMPFPKPR